MDELEVKSFSLGFFSTNAYLIIHKAHSRCVLIDAPQEVDLVGEFIEKGNLHLLYIILTHAHFDHIEGLPRFDVPCYLHSEDEPFLCNPRLNLSSFYTPVRISLEPHLVCDRQKIPFAPYDFEVIHTPGHTPGSICLRLGSYIFSGDTLFFDSIGRTDVPCASHEILINSIKEKLFPLNHESIVFPGHGEHTSLKREIAKNPFLV